MNKKRLEDVRSASTGHDRQQKRAVVKKEKCEKALEEIEEKLEIMSAEEANEALADIDLVIDLVRDLHCLHSPIPITSIW